MCLCSRTGSQTWKWSVRETSVTSSSPQEVGAVGTWEPSAPQKTLPLWMSECEFCQTPSSTAGFLDHCFIFFHSFCNNTGWILKLNSLKRSPRFACLNSLKSQQQGGVIVFGTYCSRFWPEVELLKQSHLTHLISQTVVSPLHFPTAAVSSTAHTCRPDMKLVSYRHNMSVTSDKNTHKSTNFLSL